MIKKSIYILIVLFIIIICTVTCRFIDKTGQIQWEYIENDGEFLRIDVGGVIYTENYTSQWKPESTDLEAIGDNLYYYSCDVDHIFIFLKESRWEDIGSKFFKREDVNLPPVNSENVDEICFEYPFYKEPNDNTYFIKNKNEDMIKKIFACMENPIVFESDFINKNQNKGSYSGVGEIILYNDDLHGIEVSRCVYAIGDKYFIRIVYPDIYAEISTELLSEITGINMPEAKDFAKLSLEEIYDFYGVDFE